MQCDSYPSVPSAALHWVVVQEGTRMEYSTENMVDHMEDGSWTTRSVLEFEAGQGEDAVVECFATHEALGEDSRAFAHVIDIGKETKYKWKAPSLIFVIFHYLTDGNILSQGLKVLHYVRQGVTEPGLLLLLFLSLNLF